MKLTALILASALGSVGPPAAPDPKAYVAPHVSIPWDGPGLALLEALPTAAHHPNSPGFLLEVPAPALGSPETAPAIERAISLARRAGRYAAVLVEMPPVAIPADPRAAEAASADSLTPGLGALLRSARQAELLGLEFGAVSNDPRGPRFVLKKVASEFRALAPFGRTVLLFRQSPPGLFPAGAAGILDEETAAYVDLLGIRLAGRPSDPEALRAAADALVLGRPLLVLSGEDLELEEHLALAARFAASGSPILAARRASRSSLEPALDQLGAVLDGDFGSDGRAASAVAESGRGLAVARVVSGLDLGGVVVVSGTGTEGGVYRGPLTLTLDSPAYSGAEVVELASGRSKRFELPKSASPPRLALSTANGPIAVRLTAREPSPAEATRARVGVEAARGLTAEEILARHQAWRARRDARWSRFAAVNQTSIRFRFADLNNTLELTLRGPFFFERGGGYDWAWSEAYFNGVRWRGKKIPELPLLQPEKVAELPLALTFNDSYRYELSGEETVLGVRCYRLAFEPRETVSEKPLYAGDVWISAADFAVVRTRTKQLNLTGEVQAVDETSDFTEIAAPDGGAPLRFPTRTVGQWIMRTFSRTTVLERETVLEGLRLNPPKYDEEKRAAWAGRDVMVRDTERGVRYLERTKEGERVVVEDAKTSRIFGLLGVFYDGSYDYPLPLAGVYYLDLDFRKQKQQVQLFFGGVLLAASFNEPRFLGTKLDVGGDLFGIAIRGTDTLYVTGAEDKAQNVKQRSVAGGLNVGYPLTRHLKLALTAGLTHRDYAADTDTAPDFAVPSNHWVQRLEAHAIADVEGWALSARFGWNRRTQWEAWGYPGNPDYAPDKDKFQTYSLQLAKDFHFPSFQRLRTSVTYLGSSNTDRFSEYTFGSFGGSSLRGFRSGSLRAEQGIVARGAYGVAVGDFLRIEGLYEHAIVKDRASGLDWANFGGAGVSGQLPGPWSTILQLDAGTPVVGRNRGQKGIVLNLVLLKIF